MQIFGTDGYHATRIEDIATAAGKSRATVYQYFASKQDLYRELASRVGTSLLSCIADRPSFGPDGAGAAELRAWLSDYRQIFLRYRPVFASWSQAMSADARLGELGQHFETTFLPRLAEQLQRSGVRDMEPQAAALAVQTVSTGLWARERGMDIDSEVIVEELAAVVGRALLDSGGSRAGTRHKGTGRTLRSIAPKDEPRPNPRQELLRAAAMVIAQRGLEGARIDDIVSEAGVSHGGFYLHFADKGSVVRELAEHWHQDVEVLVADLAEIGAAPPLAGLRRWLVRWVDSFRIHLAISRVWADGDALALDLQDQARASSVALEHAVRRLVAHTGASAELLTVRTAAMCALLEDFPLQAALYGRLIDLGSEVDILERLITRGLLVRTSSQPS